MFFMIVSICSNASGQKMKYELIEKDSIVWVYDTVHLTSSQDHFCIDLIDTLPNHPFLLQYTVHNNSGESMEVIFGTEGVIKPITKLTTLKPNESMVAVYRFKNVRNPGSKFSQVGKVYSRPVDDFEHSFYQWFIITGTWGY